MAIDTDLFLELFTLETIPACDEGMQIAEAFLAACGTAVERLGIDADRATFLALWDDLTAHYQSCPNCQEL